MCATSLKLIERYMYSCTRSQHDQSQLKYAPGITHPPDGAILLKLPSQLGLRSVKVLRGGEGRGGEGRGDQLRMKN